MSVASNQSKTVELIISVSWDHISFVRQIRGYRLKFNKEYLRKCDRSVHLLAELRANKTITESQMKILMTKTMRKVERHVVTINKLTKRVHRTRGNYLLQINNKAKS